MKGAEEPGKTREDNIEVDADLDNGAMKTSKLASGDVDAAASIEVSDEIILDDGAIEVADDEIETTDEMPSRPTQPSPPSAGVIRSRPPMRPSARPRPPSGSSALPPPRVLAGSEPASGWPASNRPGGADPWLLANKTLELSRAHARIAELEEHLAFRDARIATLEGKLEKAQQRLDELEQKPSAGRGGIGRPVPVRGAAKGLTSAGATTAQPIRVNPVAKPVVTETRLVAAVKPALPAADASPMDADDELDEDDLDGEPGSSAGDADEVFVASSNEEDLRQISGIGPRFEAALRRQGITRLSQIAAWSDSDVRQVAKALKIPKSRIVKGRWVEAAREAMGARAASE